MGQMKKMKAVIDDLHSCSEQLSDIAAELEAMFSTAPEEVTVPAKTPKPELKLEDVRARLSGHLPCGSHRRSARPDRKVRRGQTL